MPPAVSPTIRSLLPRLSIRTWLLLLALSFVLPMGAILFRYLVIWEEQDSRAVAYARIKTLADATAGQIELLLRDQEAALAVVATEFRGKPPIRSRYFRPQQFMDLHPQFTNLTVHDAHANTIYSYLPYPSAAEAQRLFPWQAQASRREVFAVGDAIFGPLSGKWIAVLTHPVWSEKGERSGFVSASIDLLWLNERLLGTVPKNTVLAVADRQGKFMLRSTDPGTWIGKEGPVALRGVPEEQREGFTTLVG
ncbi:MAG: PDC sensor domain-containing protein, partial [Rhodoferax sp.]